MPYVEAVILESLRVSNLVPTILPHTTNEDITVDGKVSINAFFLLSHTMPVEDNPHEIIAITLSFH